MAEVAKRQPNMIEVFMAGSKKGFYLMVEVILPALILGFVLVKILNTLGVMALAGQYLSPVMAIFGLPGESIVVLIAAFFAKAAGAATAANLYNEGVITAAQATILFPATMMMGTLVGNFVRVIMVSQTNVKWFPIMVAAALIDSAIVMLMTRFVLSL
ncbi:MAG: nucleoside recognition domain-containing protein [Sporomusaceae bacterium]|nr:nucleoside recognition domain-containing protein [Sporomusaceae bacterium]